MSLEEMHYVMELPTGEFPYEENIPCAEELDILKVNEPELYDLLESDVPLPHLYGHPGCEAWRNIILELGGYLFPCSGTSTVTMKPCRDVQDVTICSRILMDKSSIIHTNEEDEGDFPCNIEFTNFH